MSNVFTRSWEITKLSFSVIRKDKKLLVMPILSGFFSLAFMLAMLFPTLFAGLLGEDGSGFGLLIAFLTYLGLAFIAVFFNVATVYLVKKRFEGESESIWDSIGFAFSKIHLVFSWALISAIVGLLLRILQNAARNQKGPLAIVGRLFASLLRMGWAILTLFVVPAIVYKNLGPIAAIKESAYTIKNTWGESLIRHFGLGLMQFVFIAIGAIISIGIGFLLNLLTEYGIVIALAIAIIYIALTALVFTIANTVFNTALYVYAQTGRVPSDFNENVLRNAFEKKEEDL